MKENSAAVQDLIQSNIFGAYKLHILLKERCVAQNRQNGRQNYLKIKAAKLMIQPLLVSSAFLAQLSTQKLFKSSYFSPMPLPTGFTQAASKVFLKQTK